MITADEALSLIAAKVGPLGSETIELADAAGRTLAEPLIARCDAPRQPLSAMDGYAVVERTTAPGKRLELIGESRAGRGFAGIVGPGQAVRIFTGAPLPDGADYVVMQEYASRDGDHVTFTEGYGPAPHVRAVASDFSKGAELVPAGTRLGARAMVAAAAADVSEVCVARRPRVATFATGDELALPGFAYLRPDAIPESVSFGVSAMVAQEGGTVVSRRTGADELDALIAAADAALNEADLVIVTGGASVGDRDFAKPMFAPHGLDLWFDKVAMKPGKPVWLGQARGTVVLGLPGNPTSAMVTGALFLRPILARLLGEAKAHPWHCLPLAAGLKATGTRETFTRARWDEDGLIPLDNQDSGAQAALLQADWLIRCLPDQAALAPGAMVTALRF
ncbi:molybdopterin molybdotransferase MoeA [Qipengyuania mesophila]|uniref:molybdopterin molybdotransferase MoeA n=1 Tax=Qipengyuania mesophila TaxID=2867246 RepID=UPI003516533C